MSSYLNLLVCYSLCLCSCVCVSVSVSANAELGDCTLSDVHQWTVCVGVGECDYAR